MRKTGILSGILTAAVLCFLAGSIFAGSGPQALAASSGFYIPAATPIIDGPLTPPPEFPPLPPKMLKGSVTGWPVPRFASLQASEAYMRAGPGFTYPIKWVYRRLGMPVEVLREFNNWRLVVAPDGAIGWMDQVLLSQRRTFMVRFKLALLLSSPESGADPVAKLMPGVVGVIRACGGGSLWCKVKADGYSGYILRAEIWGTFEGQAVSSGTAHF